MELETSALVSGTGPEAPADQRLRHHRDDGPRHLPALRIADLNALAGQPDRSADCHYAGVRVGQATGRPVPIGVPGELYIGGAGLARGYLNRPELTAEKFVPNPFRGHPDARLYRTGDRCRWLRTGIWSSWDGSTSRSSCAAFASSWARSRRCSTSTRGAQSVVVLREDRPGDKRLVAYCVSAGGVALDVTDCDASSAYPLPDYMVPSVFVPLEALPLTPSGKIDRRALPRRTAHARSWKACTCAPRNPIEEHLASIWGDVLGIHSIGMHDNFFALGGHSLLAARVAAQVTAALEVDLPLRRLFEAPTIAELAIAINVLRSGGAHSPATPLERMDRQRTERLPLSFAQQRLWFLEQMEGELTAYNLPYAWRLRGPLNTEALRRALEAIVQRHEPLRTTFAVVAGEPVQVIGTIERLELPVEDLRGLAADQQAAAIVQRCGAEAERPFDLTRDLMLRASLLRLAADEHRVAADAAPHRRGWLVDACPMACTGTSVRRLLPRRMPELPELPVHYADYAVWQRKALEGQRLDRLLQYWREQLEG